MAGKDKTGYESILSDKGNDIRCKLWSALHNVISPAKLASNDVNISTEGCVALAVVSRYAEFRHGEEWCAVRRNLAQEYVHVFCIH